MNENMDAPTTLPVKPYLIRAYYECIADQNLTPYLLVQTRLPQVVVPEKHIDPDDGTIVLNIAAVATNKLIISNEAVQFQARFDGVIWDVYVPMYAVAGIYAAENGEGMLFEIEEENIPQASPSQAVTTSKPMPATDRPQLRIVRPDKD